MYRPVLCYKKKRPNTIVFLFLDSDMIHAFKFRFHFAINMMPAFKFRHHIDKDKGVEFKEGTICRGHDIANKKANAFNCRYHIERDII